MPSVRFFRSLIMAAFAFFLTATVCAATETVPAPDDTQIRNALATFWEQLRHRQLNEIDHSLAAWNRDSMKELWQEDEFPDDESFESKKQYILNNLYEQRRILLSESNPWQSEKAQFERKSCRSVADALEPGYICELAMPQALENIYNDFFLKATVVFSLSDSKMKNGNWGRC